MHSLPLLCSQLLLRGKGEFSKPNAEPLISLRGLQTTRTSVLIQRGENPRGEKALLLSTQFIPSSTFVQIDATELEMTTSNFFTLCFFMFHLLLSITGVESSDQASRVWRIHLKPPSLFMAVEKKSISDFVLASACPFSWSCKFVVHKEIRAAF